MMLATRRTFVTGTLATSAAAVLPWRRAFAQEELKLATFVPPTHIQMAKVIIPCSQAIANATGIKLTVRMFPSMQLGGSTGRWCRGFPTSASRCPATRRTIFP